MRPHEIDYTSRAKHYIDLSNGEILAGEEAREIYSEQHDAENIANLGTVLRQPAETVSHITEERLDTVTWPKEKYVEYGRWLLAILDRPVEKRAMRLNSDVLRTARYLGVGPSHVRIKSLFENYSGFYKEIGTREAKVTGTFKDWDIEDFVAYIKKSVGPKPPVSFSKKIDRLSRDNPNRPTYTYISERFKEIGGLQKLVELAGYPVIKLWEREDYIDWGIKFIQANDGLIPNSRMIDFLSKQNLGPSCTTIRTKFNSLGEYQKLVIAAFEKVIEQQRKERTEKISMIESSFTENEVPIELFSDDDDTTEQTFEQIRKNLGDQEIITRVAKFQVLNALVENMLPETKLRLSKGAKKNDRGFTAAIRRHHDIPAGKIEYTALLMGVFDDIWPPDNSLLRHLKLNESFEKFSMLREAAKETRPKLRPRLPVTQ